MNDKISIIIPAYNVECYLGRCLKSVCEQSYNNLEIIVVDDGSTDGTAKVIEKIAKEDKRIKPLYKSNGGVTSARLEGIKASTGGYIGFVDGDDYIEPDMYQRLYKNAIEYKADISHCGYQMVFPNGRTDYYYNSGKIVKQTNSSGLKDLLKGDFVEPGLWNKLYRRELFYSTDVLNMDCSIKINEDLLFNYYLFKKSRCAIYEDQCYYHYIIRPNSAATSAINENKLSDPLKVLRIMLEDNITGNVYYNLIFNRLIRQLILIATMSSKANSALIHPHKMAAEQELRQRLPSILKCHDCNIKIKMMAVWVSLVPRSYQVIHFLYEKFTGLDKKYSIDD